MRAKIKEPAIRLVRALIMAIAVFFAAFDHSLSVAKPREKSRRPNPTGNGVARTAETNRILWVLENRMDGQLPQEKTKGKLSTLSPEELRLLDALAARIIDSDHTAAADIAFFLITTLLISS